MGLLREIVHRWREAHTQTTRHIEDAEEQQKQIKHELSQIEQRTDTLRRLVLSMRKPPDVQ